MAELPFVFGNNGSLGGKDWSFTDEEIAYSVRSNLRCRVSPGYVVCCPFLSVNVDEQPG